MCHSIAAHFLDFKVQIVIELRCLFTVQTTCQDTLINNNKNKRHWPVFLKVDLLQSPFIPGISQTKRIVFFLFVFFFILVLIHDIQGNNVKIDMSLPIISSHNIQRFQFQKQFAKQQQNKIKSVQSDLFMDKSIPLVRIQTIVYTVK